MSLILRESVALAAMAKLSRQEDASRDASFSKAQAESVLRVRSDRCACAQESSYNVVEDWPLRPWPNFSS